MIEQDNDVGKKSLLMFSEAARSIVDPITVTSLTTRFYRPELQDRLHELRDALSIGQIASKAWLLEEMTYFIPDGGKILVVGSWFGLLPIGINEFFASYTRDPFQIVAVDIDPLACEVAHKMCEYSSDISIWNCDAYDMTKIYYPEFDVVVNTSLEHFPDIEKWASLIPSGKLMAVQCNNFGEIPDHISCVNDVDELEERLDVDTLFKGTLDLGNYKRFMVIGYKK